MPSEIGEKWVAECLKTRFPLPLPHVGNSVREKNRAVSNSVNETECLVIVSKFYLYNLKNKNIRRRGAGTQG